MDPRFENMNMNIYVHHETAAKLKQAIYDNILKGQESTAKKAIILGFLEAEVQDGREYTIEEIKKLRSEDVEILFQKMIKAQKKVGITPKQDVVSSSWFIKNIAKKE